MCFSLSKYGASLCGHCTTITHGHSHCELFCELCCELCELCDELCDECVMNCVMSCVMSSLCYELCCELHLWSGVWWAVWWVVWWVVWLVVWWAMLCGGGRGGSIGRASASRSNGCCAWSFSAHYKWTVIIIMFISGNLPNSQGFWAFKYYILPYWASLTSAT